MQIDLISIFFTKSPAERKDGRCRKQKRRPEGGSFFRILLLCLLARGLRANFIIQNS